mmetsp:Transcript_25602/g.26700  ORF Transcript_25602/g.26700 Transcript_25602/m.26700 type:complete len:202 (-) Transcript_25602:43-648(-)
MESNNDLSENYHKIVEESATCPICLKLAEDAMESECCGFFFCNKCIVRLEKKECPCCRETKFKYHSALGMRKLIKNLPVKCVFACGYVDSNENIRKHYFNCKFRDFHCSIHHCQVVMKREDFLEHLMKEHSEVMINISENFDKVFPPKVQKKIKEPDFKNSIKEKNEIVVYNNGNSNKLTNSMMRPPIYFDEIIEFDDSEN